MNTETNEANPAPKKWSFTAIPHALKALDQWNPCYIPGSTDPLGAVITTAKRPVGGPRSPSNMKPFSVVSSALTTGQYFGLCLTPNDKLICIDVDHLPQNCTVDDLPLMIKTLLDVKPTYVEISPSGQGLHIYYLTDKQGLAHRKDQDKATNDFKGSVFIRNQFVTVTGHMHPISTASVSEISPNLIESMALKSHRVPTPLSSLKPEKTGLSQPTYTLAQLETWLTKIPPNLSESPLQPLMNRAYASFNPPITSPEDYMHWQYMAAAVHYAAKALAMTQEGEDLFVEWSLRGSNDGEQTIRQKYRDNAPKYDGHDLTHLTLIRLASAVKPIWPEPVMVKGKDGKMIISDIPDATSLLNWEALIAQFSLEVQQNEITKDYRIHGPKQITDRYFKQLYLDRSAIESDIHYFAQSNGINKATAQQANTATKWLINQGAEQYNPIKEWIDEAQATDPLPSSGPSWFQALWETLELHPHDRPMEPLYRSYMKKNLMGIIRAHYYKGEYGQSTGVVILQGGENTRKSTWITQLLTPALRGYIFPSQAELTKSAKEVSLEAGVCQIWLKDEIEAFISGNKFMKNADGVLKSFLVQSHDAYRPLYAQRPVQVPRKCIFFGTTNAQELEISSNGNRRIQVIPVKFCDTSTQAKIPMVKVYQELLNEFLATAKREQPDLWKLSQEEEALTNDMNYSERGLQSGGDLQIHEVYDFSAEFDIELYTRSSGNIDYAKLHKLKDISEAIYLATGEKPSSAALKHILQRQIGKWSGTMKNFIPYGNWTIEYGMAKYRSHGKVKQSGYVMPPLRAKEAPFEKDMV